MSVAAAIFSSVSARVINRPSRASRVIAIACAAGAASASAHGQVTASTAIAIEKLRDGSNHHQTAAAPNARRIVSGATQRAMRSANGVSLGRDDSASSVSRARLAAVVASPVRVTRTNTGALKFSEPLASDVCIPRLTGRDSPVSSDSSNSLSPSTMMPSAPTASPVATRIMSPARSSAAATCEPSRLAG